MINWIRLSGQFITLFQIYVIYHGEFMSVFHICRKIFINGQFVMGGGELHLPNFKSTRCSFLESNQFGHRCML